MLLVDQHCGNGRSIKRAPLSVSYYNEISGGHSWRGLYGEGVLPAQYCPCGYASLAINSVKFLCGNAEIVYMNVFFLHHCKFHYRVSL